MTVVVHVYTKGGNEGDVVGWVERVGSLRDELASAALETFVTKVTDTMFPAGGAWTTQVEQWRRGRGEEAVSPPILVASHDESVEPKSEAVVDEPKLEGWVEQAKAELIMVEDVDKQWETPMGQRVGELIRKDAAVTLGDENGVKDLGDRKQEG